MTSAQKRYAKQQAKEAGVSVEEWLMEQDTVRSAKLKAERKAAGVINSEVALHKNATDTLDRAVNGSAPMMFITPGGISNKNEGATSIAIYPNEEDDQPTYTVCTELGSGYVAAKEMFGTNGLKEWVLTLTNISDGSAVEIFYVSKSEPNTDKDNALSAMAIVAKVVAYEHFEDGEWRKDITPKNVRLAELCAAMATNQVHFTVMASPNNIGLVRYRNNF